MQDYTPTIVIITCAFLLIVLVIALVVSSGFRNAMIGGNGEATVLGILSVKGVAIVLLCALFLGGLLYSLNFSSQHPAPVIPVDEIETCKAWKSTAYRLPDKKDSWIDDIQTKLSKATPRKGDIFGTVSISGKSTDIHFWWCGSSDGKKWLVNEANQRAWSSFKFKSPEGVPIGFFSGTGGGHSLWYLTPILN